MPVLSHPSRSDDLSVELEFRILVGEVRPGSTPAERGFEGPLPVLDSLGVTEDPIEPERKAAAPRRNKAAVAPRKNEERQAEAPAPAPSKGDTAE
ncbi:hypothetical protein [Allonocardiopsis opalescens]|uniref:Uncharacterized protein n=1 Tax=Allonocardiopsis opalescens TaxID=1144618 RepID=A0A2T0QCG5_9ACTN|nr:hypothetical protein [Allonocardiopsis opalescens]PRY01609.1 hypothetical protein CLV72_101192 [Allonocardiopsis opalescens]